MNRKQVSLVFATLLLMATLPSHSTASVAIDAESAELDLETAPTRKSLVATKYMLATWLNSRKLVAFRNVHEVPSGPNPVGNHHHRSTESRPGTLPMDIMLSKMKWKWL